MDRAATVDRRRAHHRVGAAAILTFLAFLVLGALHRPAAAEPTPAAAPAVTATPTPDNEPQFGPRRGGRRFGGPGGGPGGGGPGFGGGGQPPGEPVPVPNTDGGFS